MGPRIQIDQLGPGGATDVIEKWNLNNPLITSVTFGDLSYENDAILNITIGITYDWAELNDQGLGLNGRATPWTEMPDI